MLDMHVLYQWHMCAMHMCARPVTEVCPFPVLLHYAVNIQEGWRHNIKASQANEASHRSSTVWGGRAEWILLAATLGLESGAAANIFWQVIF